jgi:hypothetical protein
MAPGNLLADNITLGGHHGDNVDQQHGHKE